HGRRSAEDAATMVRARDAWGPWARELQSLTGIDIGHRTTGILRLAFTEAERAALEADVAWQRSCGLHASLLDGAAAREVEPMLAPEVTGAAHFPDDGQVDPPVLLRALVAAAARQARITVRSGTTVQRLLVEGDRCAGVVLDDGELRADATVVAAGSWSSLVPG